MWDDVIIGEGRRGCSATKVFAIKGDHSISENSTSYWISGLFLGLGMTVFKDTEEGATLGQLIKEGVHIDSFKPWLDQLVLDRVSRGRLKAAITNAITDAYRRGSDDRVKKIKAALGVWD